MRSANYITSEKKLLIVIYNSDIYKHLNPIVGCIYFKPDINKRCFNSCFNFTFFCMGVKLGLSH
jgi:hypothetical protein